MNLEKIAVILRGGQIYAQHAHNFSCGTPFHSDHNFFGDVYDAYADAYDSVIERSIGLGARPNGLEIARKGITAVSEFPLECENDNRAFYQALALIEQELCSAIESCCKSNRYSEGTIQLIGELCNQSEMRQYKIRQRLE